MSHGNQFRWPCSSPSGVCSMPCRPVCCCCIIGEPRSWIDAENKGCPLGSNGCSTRRCRSFICTPSCFCHSFCYGGSCSEIQTGGGLCFDLFRSSFFPP